MKRKLLLILISICTLASYNLLYAQKGSTQLSVVSGYENFTSVESSLSHGIFVQLDLKSYFLDRFFAVGSVGYGFLNGKKEVTRYHPSNPNTPPVDTEQTTWGINLYSGIGGGLDFLRLDNNRHRFYASLQGGFAVIERKESSEIYWNDKAIALTKYNKVRGPEYSGIGIFTLGYDFYVNKNLSLGLTGIYAAGSFGDIPNAGFRIGYTFL